MNAEILFVDGLSLYRLSAEDLSKSAAQFGIWPPVEGIAKCLHRSGSVTVAAGAPDRTRARAGCEDRKSSPLAALGLRPYQYSAVKALLARESRVKKLYLIEKNRNWLNEVIDVKEILTARIAMHGNPSLVVVRPRNYAQARDLVEQRYRARLL